MVLKASEIHSNFFPQNVKYATQDADAQEGGAQSHGASTRVNSPAASRRQSHAGLVNASHETLSGGATSTEKGKDTDPFSADNIILVTWDGDDDPENPMNWPQRKKYITTGLLCAMCLFIGLATAGYSDGITEMCQELGCSDEVGRVGQFLFNAAFAIVPLFLGPLSEFVGAQPVYLICYALFVIFFIPLALAQNIGTVLVSRWFLGCFGAAGVTIIPGTLASIWETKERGNKVALFSLLAVVGTVGAPLYNGYIELYKGWRWISWVQLIINGAVLLVEIIFLRETRGSVILTRRAKKLRKEKNDHRYRAAAEVETPSIKALLHASTTRAAVLLVREPVVLCFSLWLAYEWALIFALFAGIPSVFSGLHGWGTGNVGLAYIGPILGAFAAFAVNFHAAYLYKRATERNNGIPVPEARLYYATVGGIISTMGMFIFAFTSYRHVHWMGPEVGLFLLIAGIFFVFDAVQNYLSDAYGEYASSAISAQGFVRNLLAASFPLFTTQMFNNLTVPYAGLLLACLLLLACPLPFILIKYGERIRATSKYAAATTGVPDPKNEEEAISGPVLGAARSRKNTIVTKKGEVTKMPVEKEAVPVEGETTVTAPVEKEMATQ